jgi:hypothetical protein
VRLLPDLAAQKDHRNTAGSLVDAQPLGEPKASETGHADVGEDQIRTFAARLLERIKSVCGFMHVQALGLEG